MAKSDSIPVLEIGGTHLTAALVDSTTWTVAEGSLSRVSVDGQVSAAEFIADMVQAAEGLRLQRPSSWVVAVPSPFDYASGTALFENVGKFENLYGTNLGEALMDRLTPAPSDIHFLNDADAFGVGEGAVGAARGHRRAVCITLGTGVGSSFLDRGSPVTSGSAVPPEGRAHLLRYDGRPLEETVSRRAIRAAYAAATGAAENDVADVHIIAERSRDGDAPAARVLQEAFKHLGEALGPIIEAFEATVLVIGGSMAGSWDIVEPSIRRGILQAVPSLRGIPLKPAERPDDAALVGAAYWALNLAK